MGLLPAGAESGTKARQPHQLGAVRSVPLSLILHCGTIYAIFGFTFVSYATFIVTTMVRQYGFSQQVAGFIATLTEDQRKTWNAAMEAQLSAKRVTLYKLVDGKPQAVMARLGASDGSSTEVSGRNIAEGDQIISGERSAATESK